MNRALPAPNNKQNDQPSPTQPPDRDDRFDYIDSYKVHFYTGTNACCLAVHCPSKRLVHFAKVMGM